MEHRLLYPDFSCSLPTSFHIEPGNICNLSCPFCPTGTKEKGPEKDFISLDNYRIMLEKIAPNAELLGLYLHGEPFLHKDIFKMISMGAERGIAVQISSNLTKKDLDHEAVVRSGLDLLIVSLDGLSQYSYGQYRKGGDFQTVMDNMAAIQKMKKRLKKDNPKIVWSFLVNSFNEKELDEARDVAAKLGIGIMVQLMDVWSPDWESSYHKRGIEPLCVAKSDPALYYAADRVLPTPLETMALHPKLLGCCKQIYNVMIMNWDGHVLPCCVVYKKGITLGNILEQDVAEIWNNKAFRDSRRFLFEYQEGKNDNSLCGKLQCSARHLWNTSEKFVMG
jgi:radical SAM protein with 4Fe4S-binding SPASM domain